jgi:hypothetical protein
MTSQDYALAMQSLKRQGYDLSRFAKVPQKTATRAVAP